MAKLIQAIGLYSPRVKAGAKVSTEELAELLAQRTSLKSSEVKMVLDELSEGVVFFARSGRSVTLQGIGNFFASVDLTGDFNISYRASTKLATALDQGRFRGTVHNREYIGMTSADLKRIWNEEHPDDPIP